MKRFGFALVAVTCLAALGAPWLAPNPPNRQFRELMYAPPTAIHVYDGGPAAPFIYRWDLVSRIERRFAESRGQRVTLQWFAGGRLLQGDPERGAPLLLLGADSYGRDILSRLLHGARPTLLLALVATLAATALGMVIGGISGYAGGRVDALLSRLTEFVLVLPAIYVALALRAVMPLVLPTAAVFALLAVIFALLGFPIAARGVRAIVLAEREREYVIAARAAGASASRLLAKHLLPASIGYVSTQATLLFPVFILAEATMSYVGLGFPDTTPTWGTMLQDAANVALLGDAPWTLAPALAIFMVVLGINLVVQGTGRPPVQLER